MCSGPAFWTPENPVECWRQLRERQQAIVDVLERSSQIRVQSINGTDISFDVRNRRWVNGAARRNFPSGEVFTGPVETGVDGVITFSFAGLYDGVEVEGIALEFRNGKLVSATADRGNELLQYLIEIDEGASKVGELAIGTNYRIDRPIGNTLFDEKIGGTVHIALGSGYPETGSKVKSQLHWDLICDLRQGGSLRADDLDIVVDGRIVIDGWQQPPA